MRRSKCSIAGMHTTSICHLDGDPHRHAMGFIQPIGIMQLPPAVKLFRIDNDQWLGRFTVHASDSPLGGEAQASVA
jgi:hypothetical protein